MADFHLQDSSDPTPKVKPQPRKNAIPVPFTYFPSDDGVDHNLLVLLHGLGDTHAPFAKMGRQLRLPQTAVLALRAPDQIPFFDEPAFQWYTSFDQLGELIQNPNPTRALEVMKKVIDHLVCDLHWPLEQIHLFGFAQGGSVAAEVALVRWREQLQASKDGTKEGEPNAPPTTSFGSLVSVSGPLLSYPTLSTTSPTPVLIVYRPAPSDEALPPTAIKAYAKGFQSVTESRLSSNRSGMPASREEWEAIMKFWSERLFRRRMEGLYEVVSGVASG